MAGQASSPSDFNRGFERYQADQAVPMDRVAKVTSLVMWTSAACKQLAHDLPFEAALSFSCAAAAGALLAASCWRRRAYVARARWLTAAMLVYSHTVAAAICVSATEMMASRHSENAVRFWFIQMMHNVGLFQALAAHNCWPMLGIRFLWPVQLASVIVMAPRLWGMCRVAIDHDPGAPRLFAAANWLLRQVFSPVDTGPPWAASSRTLHEATCLQLNLWWLLLCGGASVYTCWLREQRARQSFARQLGPAGQQHLRSMLHRHPLYSHNRPALLVAIELYAMSAFVWEVLHLLLPGALLAWAGGPGAITTSASANSILGGGGGAADGLEAAAAAVAAQRSEL